MRLLRQRHPPPLLSSHPRLIYLASLTLALTGAPNQAAAWAVQIPEGNDPETAFQHLLLNVVIASQRDDTASVLKQASDAPLSDAGSSFERHLLLGFLVTALAAAGRNGMGSVRLPGRCARDDDDNRFVIKRGGSMIHDSAQRESGEMK